MNLLNVNIFILFKIVFEDEPEYKKKVLSQKDIRGNTPVMLLILMHSYDVRILSKYILV